MKRLGERPFTCLITPGRANPQNFNSERTRIVEAVAAAVADGISMVQVREKSLPARLLSELVSDTVKAAAGRNTLVLVNDRADIALAAGAHGVHLPESSIPAGVVRSTFSDELVIGVSTHSMAAAVLAAANGADYIFFGPVFDTPGKGPPRGLDELREIAAMLDLFPVIALGGIDERNFESVYEAGAAGIAAIRAFDSAEARRALLSSQQSVWNRMRS